MQEEEKRNETIEPRIYVDTCILQGAISGRDTKGIVFLDKAKENNWKVYTSIFTLMELLDVAKDRKFLMKSVIDRWMDVSTFLQRRKIKNLHRDDLQDLATKLNNFFLSNRFIEFINIKERAWGLVKKIGESSNLHSSDALHLVTAWVGNCHVLVTHDNQFIQEGNKILKEENVYGNLRICNIDKVEETIKEVMRMQEELLMRRLRRVMVYDDLISDFLESGEKYAEVSVKGKKSATVLSALRKRAKGRGIFVRSIDGKIYLERE